MGGGGLEGGRDWVYHLLRRSAPHILCDEALWGSWLSLDVPLSGRKYLRSISLCMASEEGSEADSTSISHPTPPTPPSFLLLTLSSVLGFSATPLFSEAEKCVYICLLSSKTSPFRSIMGEFKLLLWSHFVLQCRITIKTDREPKATVMGSDLWNPPCQWIKKPLLVSLCSHHLICSFSKMKIQYFN